MIRALTETSALLRRPVEVNDRTAFSFNADQETCRLKIGLTGDRVHHVRQTVLDSVDE